jgi:hypothetical protein
MANASTRADQVASFRRPIMWGAIALLLLAPLVAMQFTDEVAWTRWDFATAGALLIGAGAIYELVALRAPRAKQRALAGMVILAVVLIVWAEGAVGIFS